MPWKALLLPGCGYAAGMGRWKGLAPIGRDFFRLPQQFAGAMQVAPGAPRRLIFVNRDAASARSSNVGDPDVYWRQGPSHVPNAGPVYCATIDAAARAAVIGSA
jgi:hypothetical protein